MLPTIEKVQVLFRGQPVYSLKTKHALCMNRISALLFKNAPPISVKLFQFHFADRGKCDFINS